MIIRSQDKKKIFDIEGTTIKINEKNELIGYGNNQPADECELLGGYSTEEKAIKVLDMIEDAYNKCFAFIMGNDGYYHEVRESKVFKMPQDSEVKV